MAKIDVKVRTDIGDPGIHQVYGQLKPGTTMSIDEEHFGAGIFERPTADYLSPHEKADKERADKEERHVGGFEPTPKTDPSGPKDKTPKEK